MENHELRVLTLCLNKDIYRVTALNCEAAGGDPVEFRLLTEQWAVESSAGEQGYSRYKRLFFHPHCRLVPEAPMGPMILTTCHESFFLVELFMHNEVVYRFRKPHTGQSS